MELALGNLRQHSFDHATVGNRPWTACLILNLGMRVQAEQAVDRRCEIRGRHRINLRIGANAIT
jgi:hypothetical protein